MNPELGVIVCPLLAASACVLIVITGLQGEASLLRVVFHKVSPKVPTVNEQINACPVLDTSKNRTVKAAKTVLCQIRLL